MKNTASTGISRGDANVSAAEQNLKQFCRVGGLILKANELPAASCEVSYNYFRLTKMPQIHRLTAHKKLRNGGLAA